VLSVEVIGAPGEVVQLGVVVATRGLAGLELAPYSCKIGARGATTFSCTHASGNGTADAGRLLGDQRQFGGRAAGRRASGGAAALCSC